MFVKNSYNWDDFQGFLGEYVMENGYNVIIDDGVKINFGIEEEKLIDVSEQFRELEVIDIVCFEVVDFDLERFVLFFWGIKIL